MYYNFLVNSNVAKMMENIGVIDYPSSNISDILQGLLQNICFIFDTPVKDILGKMGCEISPSGKNEAID